VGDERRARATEARGADQEHFFFSIGFTFLITEKKRPGVNKKKKDQMPPRLLLAFLPPERAVVVVPTGAGVTDAQVSGRFDTPLDESFDELHALAVVYVFQARPEQYAALDVRSAMERRSVWAYRVQGVTLSEEEERALRARASALNSQRRELVRPIRAARSDEERFKRRMDAYRWLVVANQDAFFPRLLSATSVVAATLTCAPPEGGATALVSLMSHAVRAFLSAASEELLYVGVCIVCAVRVLPTSLSAPSVVRCFVRSAVAAVLPGVVHRNWVLEILRMLRTASELATSPLVSNALGARWAPLVTWLSALVNTDAMECLVGLLVGHAFGVERAIRDEVGVKCADVLVATSATLLPPWVQHILEVGLDVYKLYKVAEAAAVVLDTHQGASDGLVPVLPANRMHGLVAQLEAKFGLPAFVPKKLARSLMVAAAAAAVYSHEGDRALDRVLGALLSSQPGAASELVRCLLGAGGHGS
jgi:hypothetical protein